MIQITELLLISLFIECVVDIFKPLWTEDENALTIAEYVSMAVGVLVAVACKINMLAFVVDIPAPAWVMYFFYVLTGIAMGRGTSFLYDLWNKFKKWQTGIATEPEYADDDDSYLNVDNWSIETLKIFCRENGVDTTGCVARGDYIKAIEKTFPAIEAE